MQEKTKRFQIFITTYYYFIGIYENLNTMRLLDNLKKKIWSYQNSDRNSWRIDYTDNSDLNNISYITTTLLLCRRILLRFKKKYIYATTKIAKCYECYYRKLLVQFQSASLDTITKKYIFHSTWYAKVKAI